MEKMGRDVPDVMTEASGRWGSELNIESGRVSYQRYHHEQKETSITRPDKPGSLKGGEGFTNH
ncbi:hypothetical protein [Coleofasciculus sp. E2-BRE-01]|uniref:hypothetical protein n=1 Tax=Coleofasciculus sp. E2-BRE-01 TaxID=3069524 RepID=UPI0032F1EF70